MKLQVIEAGNFMLDGGAMFGVVPKTLWEKTYPANEKNLCNLATRCLLIEDENRKILIDTGLGYKQNEKFFSFYYRNGDYTLKSSLENAGYTCDDITDVLLTHLHFDHCGGAIEYADGELIPAFKNATYYVSKEQWKWAQHPNKREKPSFIPENINPLEESGQLRFVHNNGKLTENITIKTYDGHTQGMIAPQIRYGEKTIVYVADLIPTSAHIPVSWVCGFDVQPLNSLKEKEQFLQEAFNNGYILFFEHDAYTECCNLQMTEKGIRKGKEFKVADIIL
ncbi:MAG: MBL fold metallo-hydrolase [Bacteroidetes bacterium]|jgi:glyoxylase-like metal-dependent hydrolase (beta-lactamase superfamily II)|nr:MBL fold metallo-hydrolase [Bacteroidota bacterium]